MIVTNGRTSQQEAKIRNTGLDRLVHGWVVSETIGHRKPAPEIFHAAAEIARSLCRMRGPSATRPEPTSREQ
nr:HAD hydrolase-like protein [Micromonospora coriariae]